MYLLKIKMNKIKETNSCYCTVSYSTNYEMGLLGMFLQDFGYKHRMDMISEVLKDAFNTGITGDCSALDKKPNGKLAISFLYASDDDESALEIDPDVLLKVMKLYLQTREKTPTPEEIIIKFDQNMANPTVEAVGNLFPCSHDHYTKLE